ncbi:DMT family transporter [Cohnella endophytica]|uniref:DMT family transporter n=1 Tax=Cohnella endophytica TaxID=2419778 RepID=A0A494XEB2_9BACL|nr:DMT family transporter [Cohnella endophytica]RKP48001.1 DMT family transporter [Cohnella endophytica]
MNKKAVFQLSLAMTIFGSVGFFSGLTGLRALELVFVRCVCATLFLGAAWVVTGHHKQEKWNAKEMRLILACAVTNLLNWLFLFRAFERISVTIAISLYHLAPILVLIVGSFLFRERLSLRSVGAISVCFAGTIMIMGTDGFRVSSPDWIGMMDGVLAAVFYAATMIIGKSISKTSVYATTMLQMIVGTLLLVPFVHYGAYADILPVQWTYAIITGIVHTGIVYLLFFNSIRQLPTGIVSFLIFVDPAVAIVLDVLITGFHPNGLQSAGMLLLFGSLIYALKSPRPEAGV